ncbi:MAG: BatA domain-containing protein, partial [Alphaproteobacteria bacterium]
MSSLIASLAFSAPWVLAALIALPLVWWLLRALPPPPRQISFPSLEILRRVEVEETTPARPPWPLLLLRLMLFAAVVIALSGPRLDPGVLPDGRQPLVLIVDDGWASAKNWSAQQQALTDMIDAASAENRQLVLTTTTPTSNGEPALITGGAAEIREAQAAMTPKPWSADRKATWDRLKEAKLVGNRKAVWLSDGVNSGGAIDLATAFGSGLTLWRPAEAAAPTLLRRPARAGVELILKAERAGTEQAANLSVRALDPNGAPVARTEIAFDAGSGAAEAKLTAPIETMNRIARLEIFGETTAGGVYLLDAAWSRRKIGIVRLAEDGGHPLLDPARYLIEALGPFAEIETGPADQLINSKVDAILLTDAAGSDPDTRNLLESWTREGGLLIRFAGPRLAESPDSLTPTPLRPGGRALGGPMSWSEPLGLAPLPATGPLAGLTLPDGVAVSRQALAEPGPGLAKVTWAALADGTPLVTGAALDDGLLALIHVDAGPDWSDLPLSGFFVQMLRRLTQLATNRGSVDRTQSPPALRVLDGFGRLEPAGAGLDQLPGDESDQTAGPTLPPGYYGQEDAAVAFNLAPSIETLASLPKLSNGRTVIYGAADVTRLGPWLLLLAALLLVAEFIATLGYSGRIGRLRPWKNA